MRSFLFFVEGVHDINCVARILLINEFKEVSNINDIPEIWRSRVPRTYPFVDNRLDRFIPMPSYFIKNNLCIVMVSANGVGNIIRDIDLYLSNMTKSELKQINGVCAIFDADQKSAKEAFDEKYWDVLFYGKPDGKYQLNLWEANRRILLDAGIKEERISMPGICTCCNPLFLYSHRASHGKRGNLGAFITFR